MSSSRMLHSKGMNRPIVATNFEATMADTNGTHQVDVGKEPINADEILVLVLMLQILARNFHFIEFTKSEFTQMCAVSLEILMQWAPI